MKKHIREDSTEVKNLRVESVIGHLPLLDPKRRSTQWKICKKKNIMMRKMILKCQKEVHPAEDLEEEDNDDDCDDEDDFKIIMKYQD